MCAARREAIVSKVLTRLYPGYVSSPARQPSGKSELVTQVQRPGETHSEVAQPPAPSSSGLESERRDIGQNECNRSVDGELNLGNSIVPVNNEKELMHHQKIYTVSLPPDDHVPGPQNNNGYSTTENSDLHEDIEENQPVKRRKRRRQRKKENAASHSAPDSRNYQQPTEDQPMKSESMFINKNKKRKLQRKRQKERLKAAGLWPKMKNVELTNQPETGMVDVVEQSIAQSEEELKKTEDLLDFLQATQEIYFTERKSPCADSALSTELVLEIINQIKNGAVPFSELYLLHQLKSLLLLQDIERLKDSLDSFKEHSSMPVEDKRSLLHTILSRPYFQDVQPAVAQLETRHEDVLKMPYEAFHHPLSKVFSEHGFVLPKNYPRIHSIIADPDGRENNYQWNGRTNRASSFFIRCVWNLDLQLQYTTDD